MQRPTDLVLTDLTHRSDLLAAGFTDSELATALRAGAVRRIRPGTYAPVDDAGPRLSHLRLLRAAVHALSDEAVVCDVSAAALHGLPLWNVDLQRAHVSRQRRGGGRRGRQVHVHAAPLDDHELVEIGGLAVTSPARTVVDVARRLPLEHAVVIADGALHSGLVGTADLTAALQRAAHRRGSPAARRAIAFADGASESVGESRSRVALHRAGLPTPVPQWEVRGPSGLLGRVDFGWEELRTVGEFDGRSKYGRLLRPGQAPGEAVVAEKIREDRIRDEDLRVVRWTWDELGRFDVVANRLRRAFRDP